jgi:protein-S-isoprenylcysteine O-methyltransferase Ste14
MNTLNTKSWSGFVFLAIILGLLLFVPAWTISYWQAWLYLAVFLGSSAVITIYLMKNDPALLARRLSAGPRAEKEKSQKIIMFLVTIAFGAMFIVSALDYRFIWSDVPLYAVIAGDILVMLGFLIIFLVYKENSFSSATIEVDKEQRVISTGPYALVRHPMYSGGLLMLFATPPALGSWWGLLAFIPTVFLIVLRLLDEEKLLAKELDGYTDYQQKVRSRLIPGIF